jgi:uncharacterized protein (TIGR02588 family)
MSENRRKAENENTSRSTAEWVSLAVALLILTGIVGVVVVLWLGPQENPARFRIERGLVRTVNGHHYLSFFVFNDGDETARNVRVEGLLRGNGKEERTETIFDYVPGRTKEEGVLIFTADPAEAVLRVSSYLKPE